MPLRLLRKRAISTPSLRDSPFQGQAGSGGAFAGRLRCIAVSDSSLPLRHAACAAPAGVTFRLCRGKVPRPRRSADADFLVKSFGGVLVRGLRRCLRRASPLLRCLRHLAAAPPRLAAPPAVADNTLTIKQKSILPVSKTRQDKSLFCSLPGTYLPPLESGLHRICLQPPRPHGLPSPPAPLQSAIGFRLRPLPYMTTCAVAAAACGPGAKMSLAYATGAIFCTARSSGGAPYDRRSDSVRRVTATATEQPLAHR